MTRYSLFTSFPERTPRRRLVVLLIAAILFSLSCRTQNRTKETGLVFTDELGRTVTLKSTPQRIVSLAPSVTETLFALGLGDRVVGVTSYCDYPPEASAKEKVGDTLRPSIERIIALRTDLVIISTSSQLESFLRRLEEVGIPVYISNPRNVVETISAIEKIGRLAGVEERGRELSASLSLRVEAARRRIENSEKRSVLLLLGTDPIIVPGKTSFINDLIEKAGGASISGDQNADYPQFSLETVIARRPQVIFLQSGESRLPERLKQTPAATNGRVYHIDDALLLRPGPRVVDGLEQMAEKIHP